ncbi:MAG: tetratricopeptide repeat protein [Candidatus Melainabacteria bacterium]|nr:tetratricopeptide repeat protein [Candidatus Melainabacteria bacterium]
MRENNASQLRQKTIAWFSASGASITVPRILFSLLCLSLLNHQDICKAATKTSAIVKVVARKNKVIKWQSPHATGLSKAHPQAPQPGSTDKGKLVGQTYDKDTNLLLQSYQLEDWAANEQLTGNCGLSVRHFVEASKLTRAYFGKSNSAKTLLYCDLAVSAESAGQGGVAKQAFLQCLEYNPDLACIHLKLATLLARLGDTDKACAESRKAIELDPTEPRAHLVLSLLLEKQGRFKESITEKELAFHLLDAGLSSTWKQPPRTNEPSNQPLEMP